MGKTDMNRTLGSILQDSAIREIADEAIRKMDLSKEEMWNKTLQQLKEDHFGGNLQAGFDALFAAAESGKWFFPLYGAEEEARDEAKKGTNIVWFPSADPEADRRPWILLVPGGGFVNVWNLTEGWPVAAQFNALGHHVFILTYRVMTDGGLLAKEMDDFAQAIRMIRERAAEFHVQGDRYMTCGFSAGGYLVCLWNVKEKGYAAHGLPKPEATIPVYPVVSWKLNREDIEKDDGEFDPEDRIALFGCPMEEVYDSPFEIPEHAEGFPPTAIFVAAGDELVDPENSRLLAKALEKNGIPCRLEIGPEGGHGFADGTGMCMEGWTGRAVGWIRSL